MQMHVLHYRRFHIHQWQNHDFAIDEYETVGNAVRAFASENATVVVGTVIDMNMADEIRVTVVATGIGTDKPDISLVKTDAPRTTAAVGSANTSSASTTSSGSQAAMTATKHLEDDMADLEYIDIPTFLRKQAD